MYTRCGTRSTSRKEVSAGTLETWGQTSLCHQYCPRVFALHISTLEAMDQVAFQGSAWSFSLPRPLNPWAGGQLYPSVYLPSHKCVPGAPAMPALPQCIVTLLHLAPTAACMANPEALAAARPTPLLILGHWFFLLLSNAISHIDDFVHSGK